jgi:hypothetical protein
MKSLKLNKVSYQRRRFVLQKIDEVHDDIFSAQIDLKRRLSTESLFQITNHDESLLISSKNGIFICLEVIGIPQKSFLHQDVEAHNLYILKSQQSMYFNDFPSIKSEGDKIWHFLSQKWPKMEEFYQIVMKGNNLELHFFQQKDYIQS